MNEPNAPAVVVTDVATVCSWEGTDIPLFAYVHDEMVASVLKRLPLRTSGLLAARHRDAPAEEICTFSRNIRGSRAWKSYFDSYSDLHASDPDAGFVLHPAEQVAILSQLAARDLVPVGLFHTHRVLPAVFTRIDHELHTDYTLWHVIVSVSDRGGPALKGFRISPDRVSESRIVRVEAAPRLSEGERPARDL